MSQKPYSEACDRNKDVILEVLKTIITPQDERLLEIGSGTGQHAVHMAPHFPKLDWYPSDLGDKLAGMRLWFEEAKVQNIVRPFRYDVSKDEFPKLRFDLVYTANTLHIMHWKEVKTLIKTLGHRLREGSRVVFYGPFNYDGKFTSESNEQFDKFLKERDPLSGIRAFEDVQNNMLKQGFTLVRDLEMPANNRVLIYRRLSF